MGKTGEMRQEDPKKAAHITVTNGGERERGKLRELNGRRGERENDREHEKHRELKTKGTS